MEYNNKDIKLIKETVMSYKKQLVKKIEKFYVEVIEEFKEAELKIMADSKFRNLFRKKNYDGNIDMLRACRKQIFKIDVTDSEIPKKERDKTMEKVIKRYEACLLNFSKLCDAHIQLQEALKRKANKEELSFSEYRDAFNKVQDARNNLNNALHELDIIYTDYTYDENDDPYTFLD